VFGPASDPAVAERMRIAALVNAAKRPAPANASRDSAKRSRVAAKRSRVAAKGPRVTAKGPRVAAKRSRDSAKRPKVAAKKSPGAQGGRRPNQPTRPKAASQKDRAGGSRSGSATAQATALNRRRRIPVALAAAFAVVVLATSFPLGGLLSQHHQLAAAADQLHRLRSANSLLAEQKRQLDSNAAIQRLARADYQLVSPGQTLYDVLPPSRGSATASGGAPSVGDPGTQPLVAPANAPDMSPDPSLSQQSSTGGSGSSAAAAGSAGAPQSGSGGSSPTDRSGKVVSPSSFWSRVANSLEFWN
jgi:cell division protein FtsB